MNIAKCILDGKVYTALRFSELPPNELSNKRKHLVCPDCKTAVFFRKASRSGQAACFGAYPHNEGCSFASPETQRLEGKGIGEDINHNPGRSIKADLNHGVITFNLDAGQAINGGENQAPGARNLGRNTKKSADMHRRLSTLLINLVGSAEFGSSNQRIEIEGKGPTTVSSFFVSFKDIDRIHDEELHGYWGMLTDARLGGEGSLWLNSGGIGEVSCVIPSEMVDAFYERYKLKDEEDLAGAYVIIIGTKMISQNGKKYIKPLGVDYLEVRRVGIDSDIKDQFFITEKKKIAFFIKNNEKGIFDDQLGIKKKHYLDKNAAKEWKAKLASEYHPDKNPGDQSLNYDEIYSCINKMYNRMVGKA